MIGKARRSIAFAFLDRYSAIVIGLLATVILSRLLTPEEFGVFALAMTVVMVIDVFRDFGTGSYLLQQKELTTAHLRAGFTAVFGMSLLCALVLLLGTGGLVAFYGDARFWQLAPIFAVNLLITPFGLPGMSLLQRDLAFDAIAAINIAGSVLGLVATVALAASGYGVMSLALGTLAGNSVRVVIVSAIRPRFAAFVPTLRGWREPARFGAITTSTALINVVHDQFPQLIIGRALGLTTVGLFSRATSLCQLPDKLVTTALAPVVLPILADHVRNGRELKRAYLIGLTYMSALQWPILICLALLAEPVVTLLYGEQWNEVAPLVRIMALAALALFPAFMTYPIMVAVGRVRDTLIMSLISLPPSIMLIFVASHLGIEWVASAQFINAPLQVAVAVWFIRRAIGVTWVEICSAVRASAVVALCAALAPAAVVILAGFRFDVSIAMMAVAIAGAVSGWLAGLMVTQHRLLGELQGVVKFLRMRLRHQA